MTTLQRAKHLVFWAFLVAVVGSGIAWATLPSGPGQTDKAHSVSCALPTDQLNDAGALPVTGTITATVDTSLLATAAAQASALTALNLLTQPRTTATITKSDSTDVSSICAKGFDVGTGGDVAVIGCDDTYDAGTAPILKNIPSGTFKAGCFKRIMSTNTTASNIVCYGGTG